MAVNIIKKKKPKAIEPPIIGVVAGGEESHIPGVWNARAHYGEGQTGRFIVRQLDARGIVVEIICAVIGRAHDLPIPRPALLQCEAGDLPNLDNRFNGWLYGSLSSDLHSVEQVTAEPGIIKNRLSRWRRAPDGAAFDTWIANEKRTEKPIILADNSDTVGLIAHEEALPDGAEPECSSKNQLMKLITDGLHDFTLKRKQQDTINSTKAYPDTNWDSFSSLNGIVSTLQYQPGLSDLTAFLESRIDFLPKLIAEQCNARQKEMKLEHKPAN